jgi:predicted nucleic acid-binding Zn ribbon protein
VQLPRLDPNKEFIFNDHAALSGDVAGPVHLRHDEQWALERSMRRAPQQRVRRRRRTTWIIVLLAIVVVVVVILIAGAQPHAQGLGLGLI